MSEIIENIKDEALRESLYMNYENAQEMVKFAEAKNAAVIATSGAILSLTFNKLAFGNILETLFSSGYFFLVLSLFTSFWALYPIYPIYSLKRQITLDDNAEKEGVKLNLFVFSNIAQFPNSEVFLKSITRKYYPKRKLTPMEQDIVMSLYVSSNIALRKFWLFKYALTFFLIGCLLIVVFGPFK